ncbi:MAG: hypothetical protein JWO19_3402 [Bryobacterales bacterium]|nr:hypothetical protein [Bryobacterales bacterium]
MHDPTQHGVRLLRRVLFHLFSFPVTLAASLAALAVLTVRSRFNDPDLWWHLRTGQIIWTDRAIPRTDVLSFTTGQHPWVPHEWLSQLSIYAAWRAWDYSGLMLWLCILAAALFVIQYISCALYSGNPKIAFLGALITWFFATTGLAIRPQVLGYVLLACELLILHLGRSRDRRWFYLLPPLFALWVNSHGSFFFGMIVLAVVLICGFVHGSAGLLIARPLDTARRTTLLWAAAFSAVALFANPVGWSLVAYPLRTIFDQRMQLDAVTEWQKLSFDDVRAFGLIALAAGILLIALVRRTELYVDEVALLAVAFGMAVLHQRLLFAWGLVAAPVICRQLANAWDTYEPARDRILPNAVLILASLIAAFFAFPARSELVSQIDRGNPTAAVNFIRSSHLTGRMLNEYVYGGYLTWALPEQKVFIDGRADVYAWTGVFQDYGAWATLQEDPNRLLDKYAIDLCLLSQSAPLARVLRYLPGWSERYSDSHSVIFARSKS